MEGILQLLQSPQRRGVVGGVVALLLEFQQEMVHRGGGPIRQETFDLRPAKNLREGGRASRPPAVGQNFSILWL